MTKKIWGQTLSLDLRGCDKAVLASRQELAKFSLSLCKKIKMRAYGPPIIKRFGKGNLEGNSLVQFIETSSITGHMDEVDDRAFIDIFSCKTFNENTAKDFCKKFFKAKKVNSKNYFRY